MDRNYGEYRYETKVVSDVRDGFTALELHRTLCLDPVAGATRVAQVVFWDAVGQFFIETFGADIPVLVVEDLIAEARSVIRVR